jgi:hypothetical protein
MDAATRFELAAVEDQMSKLGYSCTWKDRASLRRLMMSTSFPVTGTDRARPFFAWSGRNLIMASPSWTFDQSRLAISPFRHPVEKANWAKSRKSSGKFSRMRSNVAASVNPCRTFPDSTRCKAKAAYQDFLTLWKDADPDIPILKQAKAEYTRVQ